MSVKPISVNVDATVNNNKNNSKPQVKSSVSFGNAGGFNPIIAMMDGIDKGGFAASFIIQDMLGMAIPRTAAGLTRNSDETGETNTAYAKLVAIREALSGPSSFIIPAVLLWGIKKHFGRANDVPINYIKGFGENFKDFASNNSSVLNNQQELKNAYYKHAVKNMVSESTDGMLSSVELDTEVQKFTNLLDEMDKAPKKYLWSPKTKDGQKIRYEKDLKSEFIEHFVELRKKHTTNPSNKIFKTWFKVREDIHGVDNKELSTPVKSFIDHLRNFTDDATKAVNKKFASSGATIEQFIETFTHKRAGSRFIANIGMTLAVISFFTIIPKLYNSKDGKNPALAGLPVDEQQISVKKEGK